MPEPIFDAAPAPRRRGWSVLLLVCAGSFFACCGSCAGLAIVAPFLPQPPTRPSPVVSPSATKADDLDLPPDPGPAATFPAVGSRCVLLANRGPIIAGRTEEEFYQMAAKALTGNKAGFDQMIAEGAAFEVGYYTTGVVFEVKKGSVGVLMTNGERRGRKCWVHPGYVSKP